jgi:hypothetical protein
MVQRQTFVRKESYSFGFEGVGGDSGFAVEEDLSSDDDVGAFGFETFEVDFVSFVSDLVFL